MNKLKIATVFSGIGSFEHAMNKLKIPHEIVFACDNGEIEISETKKEIDDYCEQHHLDAKAKNKYVKSIYRKHGKNNYMKQSYFANYKITESRWYEDIRFIDGKQYENQIDIFVGGSPCQSFSNMGKRGGLEDARGTLFYDFARLIMEMKPKVFIYENVPGMLTHDKGKTWETIKTIFDSLGYNISMDILNSFDYGIPQNRNRLFVVGTLKGEAGFKFPAKKVTKTVAADYLDSDVPAKYYLGQKGFEFVTTHKGRAKIDNPVIRTQRKNQQFNWNGDFVFVPKEKIETNVDIMNRAYISEYNGKVGAVRQMTPRECLRLMGYSDDFKIVVNDINMYRQSGNSIVVNVMESLIMEVKKCL